MPVVDFAVVGGGIVGLATALTLLDRRPGASLVLLEKEPGVARHQTGHNSGVIHAGVYYTPGSLKAQFCLAGNRATKAFCEQNGIRYDVCGKMLVATSPLEMERMRALWTTWGNPEQISVPDEIAALLWGDQARAAWRVWQRRNARYQRGLLLRRLPRTTIDALGLRPYLAKLGLVKS